MAVTLIENEIIRLGRERHCYGILTGNTSPITQQLAENVFGYETVFDIQINQYTTADGSKLFNRAPDSYHASVQWKKC